MIESGFRSYRSRWLNRAAAILATLLLVAGTVACSDATPSETPATTVPQPTKTAAVAPATPEPRTTTVPSKTVLEPTTPTATPTPTATVTPAQPSPSPTSVRPAPGDAEAVAVASAELYNLLSELVDELGHRVAGTSEELNAAEHLKTRLDAMGYSAEIQSFTFERFDIERYMRTRGENAKIVVESPVQLEFPSLLLSTTPVGWMDSGTLIPLGQGRSEDLPDNGLTGKIVLIQVDDLPLDSSQTLQALLDKVDTAAVAGAAAAVISGDVTGLGRYFPLVAAKSSIPALILPDGEAGDQLAAMSAAGEVILSVRIETEVLESRNVIAQLTGQGDSVVVVGSHYDIVPQTETGANDNASGNAIVLSLAKALAGKSLPFTVQFAFFGAEELGLYGSAHYVAALNDSELGRVRAMLNFDVVGTGPSVAVFGNSDLTAMALETAEALDIQTQIGALPPGASSDHKSFQRVGVPVLVIYASDFSRIHSPEDRLEFIQPYRLGEGFLVAGALLRSSRFPPQ